LERYHLRVLVRVLKKQLIELPAILRHAAIGRAAGRAVAVEEPERRHLAIDLFLQLVAALLDQPRLRAQIVELRLRGLQPRVVVAGLAGQQPDVLLLKSRETVLRLAQPRL